MKEAMKEAKKPALAVLFFLGLMLIYYGIAVKNRIYNSDEAYITRAAYEFANGNYLLKGFTGGNASQLWAILWSCFFSIFVGFGPENIYLVSAFNYAILVCVCCFIAAKTASGLTGERHFSIKRGLITFAVIGMPPADLDLTMHNSSHIICYALIFIVLYLTSECMAMRNVRRNIILIFLVLTLACVDDSFAIYFGALPVIFVCVLHFVFSDKNRKKAYMMGIILTVSVISVLLSQLCLYLVESRGGLVLPFMYERVFIAVENVFDNIAVSIRDILYCFSGDFSERIIVYKGTIFKVLPNAAIAAVCIYSLFWLIKRIHTLSVCVQLVVASVITCYMVITFSNLASLSAQRYYMMCFFGMATLLGITDLKMIRINRTIVCLFTLLLCGSFVLKAVPVSVIREKNTFDKVAEYLEENHLYHGYGEFWASNTVSVASNCRVQIGAVEANVDKPYTFLIDRAWYEGEAHFFVFTEGNAHNITEETVKEIYGENYELIKIDYICIMSFHEDISNSLKSPY